MPASRGVYNLKMWVPRKQSNPFSRAGLGTVVRPPPTLGTLATDGQLELRLVEVADCLSHHGEAAEEEAVIVVEELDRPERR